MCETARRKGGGVHSCVVLLYKSRDGRQIVTHCRPVAVLDAHVCNCRTEVVLDAPMCVTVAQKWRCMHRCVSNRHIEGALDAQMCETATRKWRWMPICEYLPHRSGDGCPDVCNCSTVVASDAHVR